MLTATSAVDLLRRVKIALDRTKGGAANALSLTEELALQGLDIVESGIPPAVTEADDKPHGPAVAPMPLSMRDAAPAATPARHPEHQEIVRHAVAAAAE